MHIKISKSDVVWNYAGNVINLGLNTLLLPVILRSLSIQELGIWYVFVSLAALANLMDFGFSPTIMRNISYAWSGANEIYKEGALFVESDSQSINYKLIRDIIESSKKIYLIISLFAFVIMITAGSYYIISLLESDQIHVLLSWSIFTFAIFVNIYLGYWNPILKGIGNIKKANQILVISRIVYLIFVIIGLLLGGGLIWLSLSQLFLGFITGAISRFIFEKYVGEGFTNIRRSESLQIKNIFEIIWFNAKKMGIVTIGSWLISRSSTLLCSSFLGLEITSKYGLSLQLLGIVGSISSLMINSYSPELISLKINQNNERFSRIVSRAVVVQWITNIFGILIVISLGPRFLGLIGSNSTLLPTGILWLMGVVLFLESNHSTFATIITLSNKVPFVKASIISGLAIIFISFLSLELTSLGVAGLVLSQGLVQLAYNNWRWPVIVMNENNLTISSMVRNAFLEISLIIKQL